MPKWSGGSEQAQKRYRLKRREFLDSLKSTPCTDCGIKYPPYVMDFDHLPGTEKKFHIGQRLNRPLDEVLEEIEKCEVVCSNCHRIRTHNRKNGD